MKAKTNSKIKLSLRQNYKKKKYSCISLVSGCNKVCVCLKIYNFCCSNIILKKSFRFNYTYPTYPIPSYNREKSFMILTVACVQLVEITNHLQAYGKTIVLERIWAIKFSIHFIKRECEDLLSELKSWPSHFI